MQNSFPGIEDFYQNRYNEDGRMARKPLEFLRCKEIISRYLICDEMEIADIGGATGAFSYWLAELGHRVHLLDYTPLHIEQAKEKGKEKNLKLASYTCGDARQIPYQDEQFDLILEMEPLYHLQDELDRMQCLSEAMRVLKKDGVVICEVISRYANLFEGFQCSLINDEKFIDILDEDLLSGNHSPGDTNYFTTAFFHTPNLIINELEQAGFSDIALVAVEGFANILNVNKFFNDERREELLLKYIRNTESISELLGVSGHYIAIGVKTAKEC
jgi:ubiquinone/menaquinone biosynthesis C-methylase UbiE